MHWLKWYCYIKWVPESYIHSKNKIEVELGLSNYATKSDLKNAAGIDTSIKLKIRYWSGRHW